MRRKEREVTDTDEIKRVLDECRICRLGLGDNGKIYIIPLNFGYEYVNDHCVLYFHGALEGRKINLIDANGYAGFEMDCAAQLVTSENACSHSELYKSIIGDGKIEILDNNDEKRHALEMLMYHNTGKRDWNMPDATLSRVAVIKLTAENLTCKEHV